MFIDKDECRLFDDGFELVKAVQALSERRKSLLERISDFDLPDLIGGLIAILITLSVVLLLIFNKSTEGISKDFMAVFALILGYYFGRARPGAPRV